MSMTLFHGEPIGPSLTVLAAMHEKYLSCDTRLIDLSIGGRYSIPCEMTPQLQMSVEGEGPVLVVDGEPLVDSVFIGCFLDEVGQGESLQGNSAYERWEIMAWCRYVIERVAPAAALLGTVTFSGERIRNLSDADFADLLNRIDCQDLKERWQALRDDATDLESLAICKGKIEQLIERLEGQLNGKTWLFDQFSLADLETYSWLSGMQSIMPDAFTDATHTQAWLERMRTRPSVAAAMTAGSDAGGSGGWAPGPEINRWG